MAGSRQRHLARARTVGWENPCSVGGLTAGRRNIAEALTAWRLPHLVFEAQLLATELVTNAARHGATQVPDVTLSRTPTGIRLEVRDACRDEVPHLHRRRPGDAGLGLHVVATAAPRWGCSVHPDGKAVWVELDR